MGFPYPPRAQQDDVAPLLDKTRGGELGHHLAVDAGLEVHTRSTRQSQILACASLPPLAGTSPPSVRRQSQAPRPRIVHRRGWRRSTSMRRPTPPSTVGHAHLEPGRRGTENMSSPPQVPIAPVVRRLPRLCLRLPVYRMVQQQFGVPPPIDPGERARFRLRRRHHAAVDRQDRL